MRETVKATATMAAPVTEAPDHATSSRSVPTCNWRGHWLTVTEFARMMGREPRTGYNWVRNGTLAEFGVPVYQFRCGGLHSGRVFIKNIY